MNNTIQFSGGRTSGYMLRKLLQKFGGKLPDGWKVCFENTGKEREETLEFIEEVSNRWKVPITWLEYDDYFDFQDYFVDGKFLTRKKRSGVRFSVVNFNTASRKGEPFIQLLNTLADYRKEIKGLGPVLPNPPQRLCTAYLKRKVCRSYLQSLGWDEWDIYMGIRKDEEHRKHSMLNWLPSNETLQCPLIDERVTKSEVMDFWSRQEFDLRLDPNSDEGNCDLCFLKSTSKLIKIMRADRSREKWWIRMEKDYEGTFNKSKLSFSELKVMIDNNDTRLQKYEGVDMDKQFDCFCGE